MGKILKKSIKIKQGNGITLIALLITIVVLLILAGVSISMLTGENGIIRQTKNAKEQTKIGEEKDAIALAYSSCKVENMMGLVTDTQLQEQLIKEGNSVTVTLDDTNLIVIFTETKHKYVLSQEGQQAGKIEQVENVNQEQATKIIDIVAYYEGDDETKSVYVLTAGGEVKAANIITENILDKLEINTESIITKNGVRKKQCNCFIDNKGKVYTWGNNDDGQLGNGTAKNSDVPICISDIEGNALKEKNIVDIYSDGYIVIAKDNNGKIYTWGRNWRGQLGNGTTENSNVPICISDIEGNALNGKNITDIYSSEDTIDTFIAKDSDGKIYTWGENYFGQLGNGTTEDSNVPICISDIEGNALKGKNIIDIYSNESTVIAKDNNGKIYTWGYGRHGELGNGATESSNVPICISDIEGNALKGKNIIDIYLIANIVIVKDSNGKIYTWGENEYGQLGNGTTEDSNVPICISDIEGNALKGKNIIDIYYDSFKVIARDSNGKIYTWGSSVRDGLGNGTTEDSNIPICISDIEGNALKGKNIIDIYYDGYAFAIAKDSNGKIYTWGYGLEGQLGNGTTESSNVPICISDIEGNALKGKNIIDIDSDGYTVIAKDNNGKIYTWGCNWYGQLGNGTTESSNVPICISDIEGHELKNKKIIKYEFIEGMIYYITEEHTYIYTYVMGSVN